MTDKTFTIVNNDAELSEFLAKLTDLSIKYQTAISEDGILFVMEPEDFPYSYAMDEDGKLVRR